MIVPSKEQKISATIPCMALLYAWHLPHRALVPIQTLYEALVRPVTPRASSTCTARWRSPPDRSRTYGADRQLRRAHTPATDKPCVNSTCR
uniref:Uncharacterized protein n=1 Tax=Stenotrophomonas maltophilia TaxID=40324 RepID=A0A0A0R1P7_STEMA|nr:hypothetical protein [Stenotrophomonas maltophilia]